jgi:hypothetical protein
MFNHYQTLSQQDLPEIERIKEKSAGFIFQKVSQISTFDKILTSPSSAITFHILT